MASVAEIDGLTISSGPAFVGLLDTYTGADAAFSMRRLASATTVLMRVRRDTGGTGDDDEADVAYNSNNELSLDSAISNASAGVTATTLGQFLNVGTVNGTTYTNPDSLTVTAEARLVTWYDQSSTNNATTRGMSVQAQIHDGTTNGDINKENGKPIVVNTGNTVLDYGLGNDPQQIYGVIKATTAVTFQSVLGSFNDAYFLLMTTQGSSSELKFSRVTTRDNGAAYTGTTRNDARLAFADQTLLYSDYTTTATNADLHFGFDVNFPMTNMQEMVIYPDTATHTITAIEGNVNAHFQIGNFGTPTSGLLATYTGAAAAYSVRQLANTAALSMRVREDATDTETNIGFDANGDLDTAAIAAHCGTANGYVVNWFDQSGEQNDATQSTLASQPQIYNGTAVTTLNSKPVIESASGAYLQSAYDGNAVFFSVSQAVDGSLFGHYDLTSGGSPNNSGWFFVAEDGSTSTIAATDITFNSARKNGTAYTLSGVNRNNIYDDFNAQHLLYLSLDTASQNLNLGYRLTPSSFPMFNMQELIIYPDTTTHTPSDIETNVNTYFSIY